jgi:hypothetical protein
VAIAPDKPPLPTRPVRAPGAVLPARAAAPLAPAPRKAHPLALGAGGVLAALVIAALLMLDPFRGPPACSNCGVPLEFADQGHDHIPAGAPHPPYNSDPPTSGWHREEFPPNWPNQPFYAVPLDDEVSVHLMEHGSLVAWYTCAAGPACDAIRDDLVGAANAIPRDAPHRLLVMPRDHLPGGAVIALGAWRHLEYLAGFDGARVGDFISHFGSAVQENMPASTPSPAPGG